MLPLLLALLIPAFAAQTPQPPVLTRAYAHNDYEHDRPLFDALDHGFFGVEADVHLRGDELMVAHTGGGIKPGRTLRALYLDPLLKRVRENGGRVYKGGPKGFILMVEFKSDGEESYPVLRLQLQPYLEMLSVYRADRIEEKAVTLVITGRRPNDMLKAEPLRYAGIDGDLRDLGKDDKTLFPVISDDLRNYFNWRGGRMDSLERERLDRYVARAHAKGRKIRFYGIPNREDAWGLMYAAGVDLINADKLDGLRDYLLKRFSWRRLFAPDTVSRLVKKLGEIPANPFR